MAIDPRRRQMEPPQPLKPVSIMWAEGVSEAEARTAVQTVRELLKVIYEVARKSGVAIGPTAIRPFGTWIIPSIKQGDPYWGTHWYIDTAFDPERRQVVATRFLDLVRREPFQQQNPHFDVALLDLELAEESGPALASALPGTATVISVHRLRAELTDERPRLEALKRLVVHNFGHVLRIEDCDQLCVMRHADTVEELLERLAEEKSSGVLFCPACRSKLLRTVMLTRLGLN
jgi:predicted Zn-dependent protease